MHRFVPPSFGWRPDLPDFRDFTPSTNSVAEALRSLKARRRTRDGSPTASKRLDLRKFFPEPFDQGTLPAACAHACTALLAYFEQRSRGQELRPSRLFLHYTARRMADALGDSSVDLRHTLKAIHHCGAPSERFWSYDPAKSDVAPDAFLYSFAVRFRAMQYVRLDGRNAHGGATLEIVKSFLVAGFPSAFGLAVPTSISRDAEIAYRPTFESLLGGHALVAVGFNDQWLGSTRGALLVRNSWGLDWGDAGYGWLPYAFVESRLAQDFWTLLHPEWLASGEFYCPTCIEPAG